MLDSIREIYKYSELFSHLVTLDLRQRYRGSVLGVLWSLLNPLLLMVVMWAVFSQIARAPDEESYALYLFSGLIVWLFFSQCIERSLTAILSNAGLMRTVYIPKLIFPLAIVGANLINLIFFLLAYLLLVFPAGHYIPGTIVLLPIPLLMATILATGGALFMSAATVFFRDLSHLTGTLLRALFYLTPVFYKVSMFGPKAEFILRFNPVFYPVVTTRDVLYYGTLPNMSDTLVGFGYALVILWLGITVFNKSKENFLYFS